MGCSASVTLVKGSGKCTTSTPAEVNSNKRGSECTVGWVIPREQKKIIQKTWRYLNDDLTGRGTKVFLKIFQLYPQIKHLFPFRYVDGDKLVKDVMFKGHASRFMQAVGAVVDNMNDLDNTIHPVLTNLGKRHVMFQDFESKFFDAFEQGMLLVWSEELGTRFDEKVKDAWQMVFKYIIRTLKGGYDGEKQMLMDADKDNVKDNVKDEDDDKDAENNGDIKEKDTENEIEV